MNPEQAHAGDVWIAPRLMGNVRPPTKERKATMCPSSRGLVVFDLDGTLLRGLTVCEILAAPLGRLPAMQSFEVLTSEAEIANARIEMARWYAGIPRARLLEPLGAAEWAPGAREGVARLLVEGVEVAIASITWQFAVEWFARQLGVSRFLGTGLSSSGAVHHVWPRDKAVWLEQLARQLRIPRGRTASVGDSGSDAEFLQAPSLRFFVGVTPPPTVSAVAHYPEGNIAEVAEAILSEWAA